MGVDFLFVCTSQFFPYQKQLALFSRNKLSEAQRLQSSLIVSLITPSDETYHIMTKFDLLIAYLSKTEIYKTTIYNTLSR